MAELTEPQSPLLPQYAFVVQFRAAVDVGQGRILGRIEHIPSGATASFTSWAELQAFFAEMLPATRAAPPGRGTEEQP